MKVIMIAAVTANGKIARHDGETSTAWTSKEDHDFFVRETKKYGVMIMGRKTFVTINRPLPGRLTIVMTRRPDEYEKQPGILEFTDEPPAAILAQLETRGFASVALAGGANIYSQFLQANLVDEILLTIEPTIFGSGPNLLVDFPGEPKLKLQGIEKLNENTILLRYQVQESRGVRQK